MNKLLNVINLTKYFDKNGRKITALDNVSFSINEGEVVGILGPNGAGKSTLINLLVGLYLPDKGDVRVYGESIYKNPEIIRKYIRIPLILRDPRFSVYESLMLTAKFWGVKNWKEEIDKWLEFFELTEDKNTQLQSSLQEIEEKLKLLGLYCQSQKY